MGRFIVTTDEAPKDAMRVACPDCRRHLDVPLPLPAPKLPVLVEQLEAFHRCPPQKGQDGEQVALGLIGARRGQDGGA
jgi:hypothetical protein